jgi:hypothetical protein
MSGGTRCIRRVTFTPVLDTSIYASGDVLFVPIEVPGAMAMVAGTGFLRGFALHDADDEGAAITLYFFRTSDAVLGTLNNAISISDADALEITGVVSTGTYTDLINSQSYFSGLLDVPLEAPAGSKSIYVAASVAATPTYAAATNIVIDLWIESE